MIRIGRLGVAVAIAGACLAAAAPAPAMPQAEAASSRLLFRTRPHLRPPRVDLLQPAAATAPGFIFVAPKNRGQAGPMILDDAGTPVWFRHVHGDRKATDFRVQEYRGKPVLTWWVGDVTGGHGGGRGIIADSRYRIIARVHARHGYKADLHEFTLTDRGTALVSIYHEVTRDARAVGGSRHQKVFDCILQEIDVRTGKLLFEWHSLRHVGLRESVMDPPESADEDFDYFHMNSIDPVGRGYLVSARHTSTVYRIGHSGRVRWKLGGKHSDFALGDGATFDLQHDARMQPDGDVRLFDNSGEDRRESRVLTLDLHRHARTAEVGRSTLHDGVWATTQGNSRVLGNGDLFVGWGSTGRFSEIAPDGTVRFDAQLPRGYDTYRAYRAPWAGRPRARPRVASQRRGGHRTVVWGSWNGATALARWQVLAGNARDDMRVMREGPRTGFETGFSVPGLWRYVAVRALDADGHVLATSRRMRTRGA